MIYLLTEYDADSYRNTAAEYGSRYYTDREKAEAKRDEYNEYLRPVYNDYVTRINAQNERARTGLAKIKVQNKALKAAGLEQFSETGFRTTTPVEFYKWLETHCNLDHWVLLEIEEGD